MDLVQLTPPPPHCGLNPSKCFFFFFFTSLILKFGMGYPKPK